MVGCAYLCEHARGSHFGGVEEEAGPLRDSASIGSVARSGGGRIMVCSSSVGRYRRIECGFEW